MKKAITYLMIATMLTACAEQNKPVSSRPAEQGQTLAKSNNVAIGAGIALALFALFALSVKGDLDDAVDSI